MAFSGCYLLVSHASGLVMRIQKQEHYFPPHHAFPIMSLKSLPWSELRCELQSNIGSGSFEN